MDSQYEYPDIDFSETEQFIHRLHANYQRELSSMCTSQLK